ncbi:hypothetical protein NCF86_03290 [Pelagerythrobacter marinus]|nr:hypothetical protein NCF86_03290 [Pelagerythrobacter marinus]
MPHDVGARRPLAADFAAQPGDQLIELHRAGQAVEAREFAYRIGRAPAAPAVDAQEGMRLERDRIDRLGAGVVGHIALSGLRFCSASVLIGAWK